MEKRKATVFFYQAKNGKVYVNIQPNKRADFGESIELSKREAERNINVFYLEDFDLEAYEKAYSIGG